MINGGELLDMIGYHKPDVFLVINENHLKTISRLTDGLGHHICDPINKTIFGMKYLVVTNTVKPKIRYEFHDRTVKEISMDIKNLKEDKFNKRK